MQVLITALISALTSIIVVILSHVLSARREIRRAEVVARETVNMKYLNPLRIHLVESQLRLSEIRRRLQDGKPCADLLTVDLPSRLSEKDTEWFNGWGVYLVSSAYLTACLFAQMKKLRDDYPYLRLGKAQDTELQGLMLQVNLAFRRDLGIFYNVQPSIGEDMLVRSEGRLRSYREFCDILRIPEQRVWMDRLIQFYLDVGRGERLESLKAALTSIEELSNFLDRAVGGGDSIGARLEVEGVPSL